MERVESLRVEQFEWNEDKRQLTLALREIDFADAAQALFEPHLEMDSNREGERRTLAICEIGGELAAVVYTMRGDACRIISARAARRNERREYRSVFG